jgi:hypothetical protein
MAPVEVRARSRHDRNAGRWLRQHRKPVEARFFYLLNFASFCQVVGTLADDAPKRTQVCYFVVSRFEPCVCCYALSNRGPAPVEVDFAARIIRADRYAVDPTGSASDPKSRGARTA